MVKPELFSDNEAAQYIGMSVAYLRADRLRGCITGHKPGPVYLKLGRSVRYRKDDLDAWLESCRVDRGKRKRTRA